MEELLELYQTMGISPAVYAYGEKALAGLAERFAAIDQVAEYNQAKVIRAMQKNRVSAACFAASTSCCDITVPAPTYSSDPKASFAH